MSLFLYSSNFATNVYIQYNETYNNSNFSHRIINSFLRVKKTGFNLIIVHFYIRRKLDKYDVKLVMRIRIRNPNPESAQFSANFGIRIRIRNPFFIANSGF